MAENFIPVPVFEDAITTGARTLGEKMDLQVVFAGSSAYTDGKTIVIPSLRQDAELSAGTIEVTRGYWHHEAAHIRYTDMRKYADEVRKAEKRGDTLFPSVLNAMEDCRIERLWMAEFPGAAGPLSTCHEAVDKNVAGQMADNPASGSDFRVIGPMAITWASGRDKGYVGTSREVCIRGLDAAVWKQTEAWYTLVKQCETLDDIIALARRVTKDMAKNPMPNGAPQPGQQPGQGQGNGAGKGGTEKGDGKSPAPGEGDKEARGDGSSSGQGGQHGTTEKGEVMSQNQPTIEPGLNIKEALGDALGEENSQYAQHRPFTTDEDKFFDRLNPGGHNEFLLGSSGVANYERVLRELTGKTQVMRRKIERGLMASLNRDWHGGFQQGRLDSKRLVSAFKGAQNVYKQRDEAPDVDTAVQIIVDGSGSMSRPISLAAAVCIALAQTMETVGCVSEVISFPGNMEGLSSAGSARYVQDMKDNPTVSYSRHHAAYWFVHKRFEDTVRKSRQSLGSMLLVPQGGTPLTDCIYGSYRRLHKRPERRLIMILVTDGQANNNQTAADAVKMVRKTGVNVVGVGIGGEWIGRICDRSVVVNDVEDLGTTVMDDFGKMLLGERFRGDNSTLAAA